MNTPSYYRYLADCLHLGDTIVYPTEAVWGLGCDPADQGAVAKLCAIKGRDAGKGLILIAATAAHLQYWLPHLSIDQLNALQSHGRRPTTYVIDHQGNVPDWVSGGRPTVAVRLTDHKAVAKLCDAFEGAIVSTSANYSGNQSTTMRGQVAKYFKPLSIAPGELGGATRPSTIINFDTKQVLRK